MQRVFEHRCACGEAACTEPEGAPKYHAHLFGGHHLRAESRRLARHETCRTPLLHHPRGCFGCYEAPPWCQPQKERGPRGDERKHTSDPDQTKKMAKKIVTSLTEPHLRLRRSVIRHPPSLLSRPYGAPVERCRTQNKREFVQHTNTCRARESRTAH